MNLSDLTHCFYAQGALSIQDMAVQRDGVWVSAIKGETAEAVEARTGATLHDFDTACKMIEEAQRATIGPARKITPEDFDYALNVLPPCRWHRGGAVEWFHVSERITGNLVEWYVRSGEEYYNFVDDARLPVDQILGRIK